MNKAIFTWKRGSYFRFLSVLLEMSVFSTFCGEAIASQWRPVVDALGRRVGNWMYRKDAAQGKDPAHYHFKKGNVEYDRRVLDPETADKFGKPEQYGHGKDGKDEDVPQEIVNDVLLQNGTKHFSSHPTSPPVHLPIPAQHLSLGEQIMDSPLAGNPAIDDRIEKTFIGTAAAAAAGIVGLVAPEVAPETDSVVSGTLSTVGRAAAAAY